jgi:hypothetical protein
MSPLETPKDKMWSGLVLALFLILEGISLCVDHVFVGKYGRTTGKVSPTISFAMGSLFFLGAICSLVYAWRRYREDKLRSNGDDQSD